MHVTKEVTVIERMEPDYRFFEMISDERKLVKKIGILAIDLDEDLSRLLPFKTRKTEGAVVAALAVDVNLLGEHFQPGDVTVFHVERGGVGRV